MKMQAGKAMEVLGLLGTALTEMRPADLERAYRKALLECHPDTAPPAGLTGETRTVDEIKQANDILKKVLSGRNNDCKQCNGRGSVPARMGTARCGACKGTGESNATGRQIDIRA